MFKSQNPLQTPLSIKILLLGILASCFTFLISTKASSQEKVKQIDLDLLSVVSQDLELDNLAQLAHQQVNEYRLSLELAPLQFNEQISQQARIHSQNMAQQRVSFSHDGFDSRIKTVAGSITYAQAAENVAYNLGYKDPVSKAVAGWIESGGHHKNMVGNYNLTGIGVAKNQAGEYYFTQIFIRAK